MIGNWINTGMLMTAIIALFVGGGAFLRSERGVSRTQPPTEARVRRLLALAAV